MDSDEEENPGPVTAPAEANSGSAVNSLILDYYKKFGRKRDLEQYFSLSTAQSDVKDPSGTFWRKMKSENDSTDSGEKKSDSSQELQKIQILNRSQCLLPSSLKKALRMLLNILMKNRITSQRKLEWDSLADVGYANESDRKTSASSLSTLERLALKQQYSNNDTKLDSIVEPPTAHSTPLDENEAKSKSKKGVGKKSTKIYKKDVDYLEVNMPHTSENNPPQSINVNLTKHIFFNVEKDGKVTVENVHKDVSVSPEKNVETSVPPRDRMDKEMQTSLTKSKDTSAPKPVQIPPQKVPVLISLNTLRRQSHRKKLRMARKKIKSKKVGKEHIPVQEKNAEQLSEAESFEYMPGHMYNQNQLTANERSGNTAGNKSSLESSGPLTTDSSNVSKHSFTKDLEKSIDILRAALQRGGDDTNLRKQLIKQVCERLLKSKYRDDESSSAFLSGLSFSSKKLGLGEGNLTTTSTSDNSGEKLNRPKKSILRNDKFNSGALASTSQSAPNLPTATNSEKLVSSNLMKNLTTSNTDSDMSRKDKSSSDNVPKTSSQELYQRYLDALKREEAYKRHLRDKEMFLKQKLVCSDSAIKAPTRPDPKLNNRLKDLIKDLTRNNYDDGSGDASKLEGGPNSSREYDRCVPNMSQRSHSVFTLSSGCNSDQNKKQNLKKRLQSDLPKPGTSKEHYCCSSHHSPKYKTCVVDSSVQVSMMPPCDNSSREHRNLSPRRNEKGESPRSLAKVVPNDATEDIKYVCLCNNKTIPDVPDNFLIFKCSRLSKGNQEETSSNASCFTRNGSPRKNKDSPNLPMSVVQCSNKTSAENVSEMKTTTKSSQTNFLLKMLRRRSSDLSPNSSYIDSNKCSPKNYNCSVGNRKPVDSKVYEATRCLQTEISINPRIPEPSLSDIIIITDCANLVSEHCREISKPEPSLSDINVLTDCANLVNDHFREVSKLSLSDLSSRQTHNVERPYRSGSSKSSGTSKEIGELFEDNYNTYANKGKTFNDKEKVGQGSESDRSEKYTIPIQGTNMTLMVSIGSNERKNKPKDMIGQCVGTERNEVTEQGTSLAEECSKSVQYDVGLSSNQTDHNSNNVGIPKDQIKHPCTMNLATQDPIFNTFPKTSPVNDRKPFRRANTGGDSFEKCAPSCSCGCSGDKENCVKNCEELKKSYSKEIGIQKDFSSSCPQAPIVSGNGPNKPTKPNMEKQNDCSMPSTSKNLCEGNSDQPSDKCKISESETDPILEMIQNITKKYSKKDFEKNKRKKCFKEIMAVLNYLLETEDNIDPTDDLCITTEKPPKPCEKPDKKSPCLPKKTDKPYCQESKIPSCITESSDCPQSTDIPGTSSDSPTCKVLNKIRKECERYHQKRCKIHSGKKCDISSSTSANCDHCRRVHHCSCRTHKCKGHKKCEKIQKKAIAYNLILQTSESISEETVCNDQMRQLQNIVVKVPSQRKQCGNVPFQEMCAKIESRMPPCSPKTNPCRSGSRPNESEISSMEEFLRKSQACCSVREYLEQNRPDFIAKSSQRQNCLRIVSDSRCPDDLYEYPMLCPMCAPILKQ
ncbi:Uncharacterized protein OBRU01_02683 [Operophtera brumata]|uniref:ALMS motif domain-containing protein n=1 Tax=Operophtera brumata TaxID=104452 RepID=A0A0L7LS60_OPEBR|nr:Uncharacterized protein OBRU01_02683 [Operophtera brumata]